ncbi:MAG TPA: hypothetical protein VLY85_03215 [Thermoplasmata archaeon]|nr:hypothetical protein [Thermoplasmata archaeon]
MRVSRAIAIWTAAIVVLLLVEVAQLTHLFTLPVQSAVANLVSFIFALVFTTILALIGALFIGIYISQRMQSASGFTLFEEEMLHMRSDVQKLSKDVAELRTRLFGPGPPEERPPGGAPPP